MREIHDIPRLRSPEKREPELFVDCYPAERGASGGDAEAAGALHRWGLNWRGMDTCALVPRNRSGRGQRLGRPDQSGLA